MINRNELLKREKTALLVIDLQEKLLPHVWRKDFIVDNITKLIGTARILDIPMVVTEHYPGGLGPTVREIAGLFEDFDPIGKIIFGAVDQPEVLDRLRELKDLGISDLVIIGIESHICIAQTALQALHQGFRVHVVSDAVSSRTEENWKVGIERTRDAGCIISSTEMAIYELLYRADGAEFKEVLKLII